MKIFVLKINQLQLFCNFDLSKFCSVKTNPLLCIHQTTNKLFKQLKTTL
jgi:hypothetical protein